tara:strand:+ start:549 stop:2180 length:1632 start_codon:yes stop_codon:yes gene_type:complete
MENWRKLLRELDVDPVAGGTSMDTAPLVAKGLSNTQAVKYSDTVKKVYKGDVDPEIGKIFASAGLILVKELGLLFEPTGQVADVNIDTGKITYTYQLVDQSSKAAVAAYEGGDYLAAGLNSAGAALASLAMIPIAGKVAKGLRKLIPSKRVEKAKKVMAQSQNLAKNLKATNNPQLVAKGVEIEESLEQIYNFQKSLKKTRIHDYTSMTRLRKASKMLLSPIKTRIAARIKAGTLKTSTTLNFKLKFDDPNIDFDDFARDFWGMGTGNRTAKSFNQDGTATGRFTGISNLQISFLPRKEAGDIRVSGALTSSRKMRGTSMELDFSIPRQYINKDGTIKTQALEEMFDQANETYMHEIFHSFQAKNSYGNFEKLPSTKDLNASDYAKYRADGDEIEAWAIQFAGRKGYQNRDALMEMWNSLIGLKSLPDNELAIRTKILTKQIKFARKKFPCMRGAWQIWKPVLDLSGDETLKSLFSDFYKLEADGKIDDKTLIPFGDCKKFRHYKGKGKVGGWNDKKLTKQIKEHLERIIKEELEALMQEKIN